MADTECSIVSSMPSRKDDESSLAGSGARVKNHYTSGEIRVEFAALAALHKSRLKRGGFVYMSHGRMPDGLLGQMQSAGWTVKSGGDQDEDIVAEAYFAEAARTFSDLTGCLEKLDESMASLHQELGKPV